MKFAEKALTMNRPPQRQKTISIVRGSFYDVAGRVQRMGRSIEAGEYGDVTDAVVVLRFHDEGRLNVKGFHYGASSCEVAQSMMHRVLTRMMNYDN